MNNQPVNWDKVLEFIPEDLKEEIREHIELHYEELMEDDHPVVLDGDVLRWKEDPIVRWIIITYRLLNDMCVFVHGKKELLPAYRRFYRGIGYSLSGYAEVFRDDGEPQNWHYFDGDEDE